MAVATSGRPRRWPAAVERHASKWIGRAIGQIANTITMLRLLSVVPLVMAILAGRIELAFWIFLAAAMSDAIDGTVARLTHSRSLFGMVLDPVADKILLAGAFLSLWWVGLVPGWFVLLLALRDMLIVLSSAALFFVTGRIEAAPLAIGKVSTAMQLVLVGMILFELVYTWQLAGLVEIGLPLVASVALASLALYAFAAWRNVPLGRRQTA